MEAQKTKRFTVVQLTVLITVGLAGVMIAPERVCGGQVGGAEDLVKGAPAGRPGRGAHDHCYPARLINEHPLYPQLLRLETHIERLNNVSARRWDLDWYSTQLTDTPLLLVAPQFPEFNADMYASYISSWRQQRVNSLPQRDTQLSADLASRLRWVEKQLRTELEDKLQRAAYSEELRLAREKAELIRRHQEALINADLTPLRAMDKDQETPSQRAAIMAKIAAAMTREKEDSQRILNEYEARMREEAQVALITEQQKLWETMKKRLQTSVSSGSKTATRMSKRLSLMEAVPYDGGVVEWKADATGPFSEDRRASGADRDAALGAAGEQVAAALGRQRGLLRNQIYRETVLAVSKTAVELDVSINIPPLEKASGQDITEQLRPLLRRMWQQ